MRGRPFTEPQELGRRLYRELQESENLPPVARCVGKAIAARMANPNYQVIRAGVYSLQRSVEKSTGRRYCKRSIRYGLALLRREGYIRTTCHAGGCRGGRISDEQGRCRGHAAEVALGPRTIGKSGFRRTRLFLRHQGCNLLHPTSFPKGNSESKEEGGAPLARFSGRRSGAAPPERRPAAPAPPERVDDGVGAVRLGDIFRSF